MKTKAVRMYGKCDLRLEEFELPALKDDEILVRLESDSLCMSSYKAAKQGSEHARVPDGIDKNPVIIGHEFCGQIVEVGKKWADKYKAGEKCSVQPALNYKGSLASPGYSYQYVGGDATYVILPNEVMECNCLLEYSGESYFAGSLAEPVSCIIGGFHCCYHATNGIWEHRMDIVKDGKMAILAGVGPMGLGAIDYALNRERKPKLLVVTDIDDTRLQRAESIFSCEYAKERGVELHYVNTAKVGNAVETLLGFTDGEGYNDVFVMAPVKPVVGRRYTCHGRMYELLRRSDRQELFRKLQFLQRPLQVHSHRRKFRRKYGRYERGSQYDEQGTHQSCRDDYSRRRTELRSRDDAESAEYQGR